MISPNIFRISSATGLGAEDRFTASLHYLIDAIPAIGQDIADLIADHSGIPRSKFIRSHDHPPGDMASRPDFMLECSDYNLLCEHKLESGLGVRQLERYLGLPAEKPTYLVLITNASQSISPEVLANQNYLRPRSSLTPYFVWDSIFPIISKQTDRLAQEFVVYMRDLEMAPPDLPSGWEHLFVDSNVASAFFDLTREARAFFQINGGRCKADPSRLGFQASYPAPWMHLLYFCVERVPNPVFKIDKGPYMVVRLYVKNSESKAIQSFQGSNEPIDGGLNIYRLLAQDEQRARWDKSLCLVFESIHELAPLLQGDPPVIRQNILNYAKVVFRQLQDIEKQDAVS